MALHIYQPVAESKAYGGQPAGVQYKRACPKGFVYGEEKVPQQGDQYRQR
jgi:hypothetical protein